MEVLYGVHPVEEALRAGGRRLEYVLVSRERAAGKGKEAADGKVRGFWSFAARPTFGCRWSPRIS